MAGAGMLFIYAELQARRGHLHQPATTTNTAAAPGQREFLCRLRERSKKAFSNVQRQAATVRLSVLS